MTGEGMPREQIRTHFSTTRGWLLALFVALSFLGLLLVAVTWLFIRGVGIWGVNQPVGWGFAISNFVWWIGIGHAGTFISAILALCHQEWRNAVNRLAETMTIFAVVCAGLFPLLHLGRPWYAYWLLPYHDSMGLWPQTRSPLVWDVFAVSTYVLISLLFWYLGLVPDLAAFRDQSRSLLKRRLYAIFALGWRGSRDQWYFYRSAHLILAAIAAPLVISVHSIVGMDFAGALVPGWHSTIFPPYFVAGAIFSGFAMVLTLATVLRPALGLQKVITTHHLDLCARFTLAMGMLVTYGYVTEVFTAYYSGDPFETGQVFYRFFGPYAVVSWIMIFCNCVVPQLLWFQAVRVSPPILFVLSLLVNVGMWSERFVIVVTSLNRDFLPSSWHLYIPTFWDWATLLGTMGLFATGYLLFGRVAPLVPTSDLRQQPEFEKVDFI